MAKNKITSSFKLFSILFVLGATLFSKALYILYLWSASDITVPDAVTYISGTISELLSLFSVAAAVCVTVYAHSYFGKKTTIQMSLVSLGCLALGKITLFLYNLIANSLSTAQIISGALSYIIEILFDALVLILAIVISYIFSKKRVVSKKADSDKVFSPMIAAITTSGVYSAILMIDLTVMNVIPFFIKYSDPTAEEIGKIIADYMFYLIDFIIIGLFAVLIIFVLSRITGKLRLKQYYEPKTEKDF